MISGPNFFSVQLTLAQSHLTLVDSLLSSLKVSPSDSGSGRKESIPKVPRSTGDSEKPVEHQILSLPRPTTAPASTVAGTVTAPLLSSISIYGDFSGPFPNPALGLDPNVAEDPINHIHNGVYPYSFLTSLSSDTAVTRLPNKATTTSALGGISILESFIDSRTPRSTDTRNLIPIYSPSRKYVGEPPRTTPIPPSDFRFNTTNGPTAKSVSNSMLIQNALTTTGSLPISLPRTPAVIESSSNLTISNFSITLSKSLQSVTQDSSFLPGKPTSSVQKGTSASMGDFRGEGARLGGGNICVLASLFVIMVVISFE